MDDGSLVRGETNITASRLRIAELMLDPPGAVPLPETLEAIERADLITVGPGSLYTSLITNLLVQGIPAALARAKGVRVYICNLMTQANESLNLTASEHIERIYEHTHAPIFDYALVNTAPFSPETLARYAARMRRADHPRHRAHRGPGRALHRRRLRQRRERRPPRRRRRDQHAAEAGASRPGQTGLIPSGH
jgi:uncharacterized cofD-like protein